jgi:hypothetical protein
MSFSNIAIVRSVLYIPLRTAVGSVQTSETAFSGAPRGPWRPTTSKVRFSAREVRRGNHQTGDVRPGDPSRDGVAVLADAHLAGRGVVRQPAGT